MFNLILLFGISLLNSQTEDKTYIKGNAASFLLAMPNIGIETRIGEKTTFQIDILASLWNSVNGVPFKFATLTPEFRYHFNEKFNGFYAGIHFGGSIYKISKYGRANEYQEGFGYMVGSTIGYQKKINTKLLLEFFIGGGSHQGFYKGYNIKTGERYDNAEKYNKSGEWIPYRGGIMIAYKLN